MQSIQYGPPNGCRFLRLNQVLAPDGPIPVCKSTWWAWVKSGKAPKPVKLSPRITAWRCEDVKAFCECLNQEVGA
ncbi:AlpA family phage regulatory protein [Terrihabitans rhizophilus]|uniref:AlpA family phage regulatory protein n=1 Tax=Terrihabitans rhizophilus TaxID=3092662 RepID=A0ABU4RTM8_9HYPH|nr:AlpA family phage regulatory protein [Terrihabitans sp. PJ23]MDX6806161.1 AlpA family phage regulatory protein [Terrihabitans sp. PJ23]